MRIRDLTFWIAAVIAIIPVALCYTPTARGQPTLDDGFIVVPLLGGTVIPVVAVTNPRLTDVRFTQSGLVDQPLPPFPLVAGKTAMLRGTLASAPGAPQSITAAYLDVVHEDTGQLV